MRNNRRYSPSRSAGQSRFDRDFGDDSPPDFGPRKRAPKRRSSPARGSPRKAAGNRSRDFEEGRRYERQRLAASLQPPRDPDGGYSEHGARKIGWRL